MKRQPPRGLSVVNALLMMHPFPVCRLSAARVSSTASRLRNCPSRTSRYWSIHAVSASSRAGFRWTGRRWGARAIASSRTPASSRPSARRSTTSSRIRAEVEAHAGPTELGRLISELPADRLEQVFTTPRGRTTARSRTSAWSSSATASSSSPSPARSSTGSGRRPRAGSAKIRARRLPRVRGGRGGVSSRRSAPRVRGVAQGRVQRISRSRNVLAAVLEAAIAAVYLERGFERIEPRSSRRSANASSTPARVMSTTRPSSRRPSHARASRCTTSVLEVEGPPHDRRFVCAAQSQESNSAWAGIDEEGRRAGGRAPGARRARRRARPRRSPQIAIDDCGSRSRKTPIAGAWRGSQRLPTRPCRENAASVHLRTLRIAASSRSRNQ